MSITFDGAEYLGLGRSRPTTEIGWADSVAQGLPVAALDRLVRLLGDDALRFRFVPRPTLARRVQQKRLSAEESARVARIAGLYAMAREVWGDDAEARAFLHRRHPLLEDRTPLDVALATDLGARLVERVLGRLHHGTAA